MLSKNFLFNKCQTSEQEVTYGRYYFKVTSSSYSNEDYTICISTNKYSYNSTTIVLQIDNPYMFVNGVSILVDEDGKVAPVIYNNRTLIPARAVIESLGGTVTWNEHTKDIYLTLNENEVKLTLGSTQAYINGSLKYLDVPATSINGRTMIPIKFVMDNFGADVIWNSNSRTVTIMY